MSPTDHAILVEALVRCYLAGRSRTAAQLELEFVARALGYDHVAAVEHASAVMVEWPVAERVA
jgi:hypothetical protein